MRCSVSRSFHIGSGVVYIRSHSVVFLGFFLFQLVCAAIVGGSALPMGKNQHKAVPKFSASVLSWKTHAEELSPTLQQIAHSTLCSTKPFIPDFWTRVQSAWLPKPGRAPTSPAQLRSIGLMGQGHDSELRGWVQASKKIDRVRYGWNPMLYH